MRACLVLSLLLVALPAAAQPRRVSLLATGDVLLHSRVAETARDRGGFGWVLGPVAPLLDPRAIAFANLETPLTDRVVRPFNGWRPILGGSPDAAAALAATGFDVISVANNHAYDQDSLGLQHTVESIRAAGLTPVGAGPDVEAALIPTVVERDGVRVAFLAFTESVNRHPRRRPRPLRVANPHLDTLEAAIRSARARADVVVVSAHWGDDFAPEPGTTRRAWARAMIAAGADVIVGHGPHILHPVERVPSPRGEAVIAWSLGNLVSPMGLRWRPGRVLPEGHPAPWHVDPRAREGLLLRISFEVTPGAVRIAALDAVPLWTDSSVVPRDAAGVPNDVRVVPLRDAPQAVVADRRPAIERSVGAAAPLVDPPAAAGGVSLATPARGH